MLYSSLQFMAVEKATGIAALGVDGRALVIQLITFALVFVVLRKFAFQPILKVLHERRTIIDSGVTLGEEMKQERAKLDKTVSDQLRKARLQADGIVTEARDEAKQATRDAEADARNRADKIVADAHVQADQDAARVMAGLRDELGNLVADATEAVADVKLDKTKDAALIDKALKRGIA